MFLTGMTKYHCRHCFSYLTEFKYWFRPNLDADRFGYLHCLIPSHSQSFLSILSGNMIINQSMEKRHEDSILWSWYRQFYFIKDYDTLHHPVYLNTLHLTVSHKVNKVGCNILIRHHFPIHIRVWTHWAATSPSPLEYIVTLENRSQTHSQASP